MNKYTILQQKMFENYEKFEKRLNDICAMGYEPVNLSHKGGLLAVLLKKK